MEVERTRNRRAGRGRACPERRWCCSTSGLFTPGAFVWRGETCEVVETLERWKASGPEVGRLHGERYLRWHYWRLEPAAEVARAFAPLWSRIRHAADRLGRVQDEAQLFVKCFLFATGVSALGGVEAAVGRRVAQRRANTSSAVKLMEDS